MWNKTIESRIKSQFLKLARNKGKSTKLELKEISWAAASLTTRFSWGQVPGSYLPFTTTKQFEFFTIGVSVRLSDRFNVTQNKINFVKNFPQWGWEPGPPDLQASALPTELSQHSVASLNLHCLYKGMLCWSCSRNEQSPTCEVVHETNKAHFRNLLTNRFLPSSVGKALAWRSGGPGFNPHWEKFLMTFFLLFPV